VKSYFICMLHSTPTSNFLYFNLYSTKSYNKYCSNVVILQQCCCNITMFLQVFFHCMQNLILHIYYVAVTLRINILKTDIFMLLQCCWNIAAIFRNIFAMLQSCNEIFLQCCCNISVLLGCQWHVIICV